MEMNIAFKTLKRLLAFTISLVRWTPRKPCRLSSSYSLGNTLDFSHHRSPSSQALVNEFIYPVIFSFKKTFGQNYVVSLLKMDPDESVIIPASYYACLLFFLWPHFARCWYPFFLEPCRLNSSSSVDPEKSRTLQFKANFNRFIRSAWMAGVYISIHEGYRYPVE